ncbi:MAG: hypothetical protein K9H16_12340 [Bacteroidales bacterium]|nr:hypothetical protein [Bacteroidales bacterium]
MKKNSIPKVTNKGQSAPKENSGNELDSLIQIKQTENKVLARIIENLNKEFGNNK